MALRTPTLGKSCEPVEHRHHDRGDQLAGCERGALRPDQEVVDRHDAARRRATARRSWRRGPTARAGRRRPASPVPRLPPIVPALRICGEPTVRAACARAGSELGQRRLHQLRVGDAGAEPHGLALDVPAVAARSTRARATTSLGPSVAEVHLDHEVGAAREHVRAGMLGERREGVVQRRRAQHGHRGILVDVGHSAVIRMPADDPLGAVEDRTRGARRGRG